MHVEKAVNDTLDLLQETLAKIGNSDYSKACAELNGASIGQHYRHVVEIFTCLSNGYESGQISYDERKRDRQLEQDKNTAAQSIRNLMNQSALPDKQLKLAASYTPGNDIEYFSTTYYRELAYALEHAVHHMAIIKIGLQFISPGLKLPENFGVASATLKHKNACAQ